VKMPLVAASICLFNLSSLFATGQEADRIRIAGKEFPLLSNPLNPWIESIPEDGRPNFRSIPRLMGERTSNWRGYVATWEISGGRLIVVNIESHEYLGIKLADFIRMRSPCPTSAKQIFAFLEASSHERYWRPFTLDRLFPGKFKDGKVEADWFSGELRVPKGKLLQYVHMGYGSSYEQELIITVDKGVVVRQVLVDNRGKKPRDPLEVMKDELEKMPEPVKTKRFIEGGF